MTPEPQEFPVQLGGNLSLDFTNTIEYRDSDRCIDTLQSYAHVLGWSHKANVLDSGELERLAIAAEKTRAQAAAAHRAALDLRETLYRIFTAVIAEEHPTSADLAHLNETLGAAARCVEPNGDGFTWAWAQSDDLAHILTPIALAAAELLTSDQLQWVRQCPNCGWLFVDTSRNHSRRWCSMGFCGSKIKSRRQYERRKHVQAKNDSVR